MTDVDKKSTTIEQNDSPLPWPTPPDAVTFQLERLLPDGSIELCEFYDPATRSWARRIPLPYGAEDILTTWGSGHYQVQFFDRVGKSKGRQRKPVHLDSAEHPPLPRQYRLPEGPERPKPPAAPAAPAAAAGLTPHGLPSLPPGLMSGDHAIASFLYWRDIAEADAERRLARTEREQRLARESERERHAQELVEQEARHKRQLEHFATLARGAGGDDVRREIAELREELAERGEESTAKVVKQVFTEMAPMLLGAFSQGKAPPQIG